MAVDRARLVRAAAWLALTFVGVRAHALGTATAPSAAHRVRSEPRGPIALGELHGRVVDSAGRPAAGLELLALADGLAPNEADAVRLRALGLSAGRSASDASTARTDQDGSFAFRGLAEGRFHVFARTGVNVATFHRLTAESVESVGASTGVALELALVSPRIVVHLVEPSGARWAGVARLPKVNGYAPDTWPSEPVVVVASIADEAVFAEADRVYLDAVSALGGEYVFECAENRRYLVALFGGSRAASVRELYVPWGASHVDVDLELRPDAPLGKLVVHARGASTAEADVSARLVLEDAKSGLRMLVAPTSSIAQPPWHLVLPVGEYRVAVEGNASVDDWHGTLTTPRSLGRWDERAQVAANEEKRLDALLPAGARLALTIRGTLTDADRAAAQRPGESLGGPTDDPAAAVQLALVAAGRWPEPVWFRWELDGTSAAGTHLRATLALGRTEVSEVVSAGRFELVARLPGGRVARAPVELVDGRTTAVELVFD